MSALPWLIAAAEALALAVIAASGWRRTGRKVDALAELQPCPSAAEVEELAAVIRSGLYPPSEAIGLRPSQSDRTAARAALRWMARKQQRGGMA